MVGVGSDEGGGRRLPPWMLGASTSDQDEKSDKTKAAKKNSKEGLSSQVFHSDPRTKKTRRVKESSLVDEENVSESFHVLEKCNMKRRKLKKKQEDEDSDYNMSGDTLEKECNRTRRKVSESASEKRLKTNEELEIQPLIEEDEDDELTVDDLMTIAREYVRCYNNTEQNQALKGKGDHRCQSTTTVPSRNESEDNISVQIHNDITTTRDISVSQNQTEAIHDTSTSSFSKSKSSLTEEIVISGDRTGDPAQDMLNLFLGPLLKKPANENKSKFLSEDVAFAEEVGIQNKTNTVGEEMAPPITKKKSSLKDKIALFL